MNLRSAGYTLAIAILVSGVASIFLRQAPQTTPPAQTRAPEPALTWRDVTGWGVEGRAWPAAERKRWFDRLPASAEGKVTDAVWGRSRESAGMLVRFRTNASTIWADYTLFRDQLALANMTAIGASGLDLYAKDSRGAWRWVGVTQPAAKTVRQAIVTGLAPGLREYMLYLPLRNGVENLSIGVPPDARFETIAPRAEPPIVFYGTSITHGASASRPGMPHPAILGRRLDHPVVNLGFTSHGRMDAAIGELLITIDAAVYVIDCLPNMAPADVKLKCVPLVNQIRAAKPNTPIVLVEDRRFTNAWIIPQRNQLHTDNHVALRECFTALQKAGVKGLFYLEGDDLLGDDSEAAMDGSHPTDLGFMRHADRFEPVLRKALGRRTEN